MVEVGDTAPDFTAPLATGEDVESFTLSEALEDGPVVLAFFPGAFTSVCSHELASFRDRLSAFEDAGVALYGVSVDSPFALNAFHDELDLNFPLISDANDELVDLYDVSMDFADLGVYGVAKRAVFVVNEDGEVTYAWVSDDPGVEPEYDEVEDAAATA
ncbi:redoxin domain-containing protein [Halomarina ordinaria]|uniref:Redoxin domain-containing protein n=1 Tax=Halomarina ordinaria TaxID=3033939 RepID=A0ABD5U9Z9_9EURY|nr:redoxin domain-containing protein [Halomarina sp. PSRA2]